MITARQLGQRARRDRERRHRPRRSTVSHTPSYPPYTARHLSQERRRHLESLDRQQHSSVVDETQSYRQYTEHLSAQQVRQHRERQVRQQILPIARRPLLPPPLEAISYRHELGRCNIVCPFCKAEHWAEEKVNESTLRAPKFSTCCMSGSIAMEKFEDPPQPLYSLLTDSTLCILSFDIISC
jgi:hypothetical protein